MKLLLLLLALGGCTSRVGLDFDRDGFPDGQDCLPADPLGFPGATDPFGDDIDQDCSGADGWDGDGDGAPAPGPGVTWDVADCDDGDANSHPGAQEIPGNGVDENCDGLDDGDRDGDGTPDSFDCAPDDPLTGNHDADGDGFLGCGGDCDDLQPAVNPNQTEVWNLRDDDCDGSRDDGLDPSAVGVALIPEERARGPIVEVGDLDGDGIPEVMTSHQQVFAADEPISILWGDLLTDRLSEPEGPFMTVIDEPFSLTGFGDSIAGLGDLDGGGRPEVAVGAPSSASNAGCVLIYRGEDLEAARDGEQPQPFGQHWGVAGTTLRFGARLLPVGDLDGDGLGELVVSGAGLFNAAEGGSRIFVLTGAELLEEGIFEHPAESAWLGAPPWEDGFNAWSSVGSALAAGDADGDGQTDLLIGGSTHGAGGRAFLFALEAEWGTPVTLSDAVASYESPLAGERLGSKVALVDFDGDGLDEVVLGAPSWRGEGADQGRVLVFDDLSASPGLHPASTAPLVLEGDEVDDRLGILVLGAGDLDGDGREDLFVGAPRTATDEVEPSRVVFVSGRELSAEPVTLRGSDVDSEFVSAVDGFLGFYGGTAPDLDGDGRRELLLDHLDGGGGPSLILIPSGQLEAAP